MLGQRLCQQGAWLFGRTERWGGKCKVLQAVSGTLTFIARAVGQVFSDWWWGTDLVKYAFEKRSLWFGAETDRMEGMERMGAHLGSSFSSWVEKSCLE